jgi:probable phosphoglycerate mutase
MSLTACAQTAARCSSSAIVRSCGFSPRWVGLAPIEGRRLLLATASLSVLGYDHDLTEPVIHAWNACAVDGGQETT